jgi:hypothetical protein
MILTIRRPSNWQSNPQDSGTFGTALLEKDTSSYNFYSGELPWRDNIPDLSCIPAGTYQAALAWMEVFGRQMYLLQNVPNRNSVFIHPGNWCGDIEKGLNSDVKGCILLGMSLGNIDDQKALLESVEAIDNFLALTGGQDLAVILE